MPRSTPAVELQQAVFNVALAIRSNPQGYAVLASTDPMTLRMKPRLDALFDLGILTKMPRFPDRYYPGRRSVVEVVPESDSDTTFSVMIKGEPHLLQYGLSFDLSAVAQGANPELLKTELARHADPGTKEREAAPPETPTVPAAAVWVVLLILRHLDGVEPGTEVTIDFKPYLAKLEKCPNHATSSLATILDGHGLFVRLSTYTFTTSEAPVKKFKISMSRGPNRREPFAPLAGLYDDLKVTANDVVQCDEVLYAHLRSIPLL